MKSTRPNPKRTEAPKPERSCRVCGCTDKRACPGGCAWVDQDLCSACLALVVPLAQREVRFIQGLLEAYQGRAVRQGPSSGDIARQLQAVLGRPGGLEGAARNHRRQRR